MTLADEVRSSLSTIQLSVEEILSILGEEPSLGDGGFAEAVISLENDIIVAMKRERER